MTCIVEANQYPSKKALKEAIEAGKEVIIRDPSVVAPFHGPLLQHPDINGLCGITITNHPKRSWFAAVRTSLGRVIVK